MNAIDATIQRVRVALDESTVLEPVEEPPNATFPKSSTCASPV